MHKGLTSMGSLAVFGISAALLVALTVMPSLMQYTKDKKILIPKSKV
jgi:predicted RND superfamily exporter protein